VSFLLSGDPEYLYKPPAAGVCCIGSSAPAAAAAADVPFLFCDDLFQKYTARPSAMMKGTPSPTPRPAPSFVADDDALLDAEVDEAVTRVSAAELAVVVAAVDAGFVEDEDAIVVLVDEV